MIKMNETSAAESVAKNADKAQDLALLALKTKDKAKADALIFDAIQFAEIAVNTAGRLYFQNSDYRHYFETSQNVLKSILKTEMFLKIGNDPFVACAMLSL